MREIFELPALVMALDFAARRVPVSKLSPKEIEAMLTEGSPWRDLMLRYLEVASHPLIGLLPRERVAGIIIDGGQTPARARSWLQEAANAAWQARFTLPRR